MFQDMLGSFNQNFVGVRTNSFDELTIFRSRIATFTSEGNRVPPAGRPGVGKVSPMTCIDLVVVATIAEANACDCELPFASVHCTTTGRAGSLPVPIDCTVALVRTAFDSKSDVDCPFGWVTVER